jgi:GNAT superfamily N-acetyltransferase
VCDRIEPWEHGTVVRASRYPDYWDLNLVRVEGTPQLSAAELATFADASLAGLEHRCVCFERIEPAEALRDEFAALGWRSLRLLWMRLDGSMPNVAAARTVEVDYDAVEHLRTAWHTEDFPGQDHGGFLAQSREVALARGARVLAVTDGGRPVAYAQIERDGDAAEITQVFVEAERRGQGLGTAVTVAAMRAGSELADLWITADDEDRPKDLYARLGFRPVTTTMEFTLPPG